MYRATLIPGDGIGPEVTAAAQRVIAAAGVEIDWDVHHAGTEVEKLTGTPLPASVLDSVRQHRVALKGPVGTPIGKGFKSVNVTLRQTLDLYANVRPIRSLPEVEKRFEVDMVIVRENTEGLYAGLELMILPGVAQSIKLTTERSSRRIAEFAFKYAERTGRKRVTIVHKANIMKISDGLALDCARKVSQSHPEVELAEMIVDAAAMTMVKDPNRLGVLVTENLYGDILSDLGAGLVGGLGIVPGANIGDECAVFEAVHGSAPDIAGKGLANPTALIQSAVMMLVHLGEHAAAQRIEEALTELYRKGEVRTKDLGGSATTKQFTDALCWAVSGSPPPSLRGEGGGGSVPPESAVRTSAPPAPSSVPRASTDTRPPGGASTGTRPPGGASTGTRPPGGASNSGGSG
jgi:isocitrate dehydrogenase (NAD+)